MLQNNTYSDGKKIARLLAENVQEHCLAYRKFLRYHRLKDIHIPFEQLPIQDKNNYINRYSLEERLYQGKKISDYYMVCTSTGSTGEPTIWPRDMDLDNILIAPHTKFLEDHFQISKKTSLILIAFGLGSSQAGIMHLKASWGAYKDAKITVVSPNGDPEMTVFLLEKLYKDYDQIICLGYPPIINDFISLAIKKKINLKKWHMKIGVTSESVSPLWRREIVDQIQGYGSDFVAWYGSTEAGMIGFETKEINEVVQLTLQHDDFRNALFGTYNLPTFVSVDYCKRFIEIVNNEIVITADQVVPLVRFNLHDKGRLISGKEILAVLKEHKLHLSHRISEDSVYLAAYGRNFAEKVFSIEDVRYVLDKIQIYESFSNEFQYDETKKDGILEITLVLYKKNLTIPPVFMNSFQGRFFRELHTIYAVPMKIHLIIKDKEESMGYKYGKLRYLLNG